ncbi:MULTISPECIES: NADH-quinone oxidoreductase subunit C [Sorangium]|uniref:NADH-quinone oxidoreductase subunit C n=1 Tax=Sorangium cellulosum TaxID=56 RepID=A0A4V0NF77_SORCE|nr:MULTISPECIES: NADH-quinone oxidoreductase subunit C [Sorangium]AUX28712.1 NADH dehydrogenase (ubiquinone) [Sorangium cellulosum]WCQ88109.1 NAD(P)H-quinone oxidoreductase subunit J, chloroplastic [Sorangium sp. Soce836]
MSKKVLEILTAQFPGAVLETHSQFGDDTAVVDPSVWRDVALFLRNDPRTLMNMFIDLTAVDYLWRGDVPRFEVVCHLRSFERNHRIRIKARVGDEEGNGAEIDSIVPVWKGANWFERECYDLLGIVFRGHPDLRRILMYPEFEGHPLRKDYPANRIQPLIPFREVPNIGKLPPFGPDEGMSFGRQTHDFALQSAGAGASLESTGGDEASDKGKPQGIGVGALQERS